MAPYPPNETWTPRSSLREDVRPLLTALPLAVVLVITVITSCNWIGARVCDLAGCWSHPPTLVEVIKMEWRWLAALCHRIY